MLTESLEKIKMGKPKATKRVNNRGFDNMDDGDEEGCSRPGWPKVILSLGMGESVAFALL